MRTLGPRLLLSACSLILAALLLEGVTRLLVPPPAPLHLRDQIYVNQIPMVTGRDTVSAVRGEPLSEKKRPGEIRIFVFGESSIAGAPWNYFGSPPTMLYDQLKARFPEKDLTVVNMGRSASAMRDAYYYLATVGRFSPDYIIFYQGNNDRFWGDYEVCLPANHPHLHRAWRWLVEHSRLAWLVRAKGPIFYVRHFKPNYMTKDWVLRAGSSEPTRCDPKEGFQAWTDLLVETAMDTGAQVYVTTPVLNPLSLECDGKHLTSTPHLATRRLVYRQLVACILSDDCNQAATWAAIGGQGGDSEVGYLAYFLLRLLNGDGLLNPLRAAEWARERSLGDAWKRSAQAHGAQVVDFFQYLAEHERYGLRRPIFLEPVHLTLDGYWLLASRWAQALAQPLGGDPTLPQPTMGSRYLSESVVALRRGPACILLHAADDYLRLDDMLISANILSLAAASEGATPDRLAASRAGLMSQLLKGWMRQHLGLDPQLPASLAALLGHVDFARLHEELTDGSTYCDSVGGDWLAPLVTKTWKKPDTNHIEKKKTEPGPNPNTAPNKDEIRSAPDPYIITPDQTETIGALLGVDTEARPGGCAMGDVQILKSFVRVAFQCPAQNDPIVIELRHPSETGSALATTRRFALVAGTHSPPAELVRDLAKSIESREQDFHWKGGQSAIRNPEAPRRTMPPPIVAALAIALTCSSGLLLFLWRRKRKRS